MNTTQISPNGEDGSGSSELLPIVYDELRRIAARMMADEPSHHTLQTTALVHEAYLRLVDAKHLQKWDGPGHFYAAAAEAMRRILVEAARRRGSLKRGGHLQRVELETSYGASESPSDNLVVLDECLTRLEAEEPVKAKLVKLRYFAGLSHQEAAEMLGISRATADRYWAYAKAWLYDEMRRTTTSDEG